MKEIVVELRQMKHFLAVAETGSFTKASEHIGLSQPALSASIAKLEAYLNVSLLTRNRTKVVPTAVGMRFLQKAQGILLACADLKQEMREATPSGPLKIGMHWTIPSRPVAELLRMFSREYPGIVVTLSDGSRSELLRRLQEGELHALIMNEDSTIKPPQFRPLFNDNFIVAAPLNHRFAHDGQIHLSDLNGEPFISCTSCERYPETLKAFADRGIEPRFTSVTDQGEGALNLVAAGIGLAIVPGMFSTPGLARIALLDFDFCRTIGLHWVSGGSHEDLDNFIKVAAHHDWHPAMQARVQPEPAIAVPS
jgi:DNA-binding transcriptional LysR family regulator